MNPVPNQNEIEHYIVLFLVSTFSAAAAKYGVDGNTLTAIATGVVAAGAAAISIYRNTNMKKVPETATVVQVTGGSSGVGPGAVVTGKVVG